MDRQKSRAMLVFKHLSPLLRNAIAKLGYKEPTPIQSKAIVPILKGKNVLIIAPTGSGKTEAALFPLFDKIIKDVEAGFNPPLMAYITPLRSLNRDIMTRMEELSSYLGLKALVKHGDTTQVGRRRFIEDTPHWFITTPESFIYMISNERTRPLLANLKYVIVDELHEIISSKRGVALSLGLSRLEKMVRHTLQYVSMSATVRRKDIGKFTAFFPSNSFIVLYDDSVKKLEVSVKIPEKVSSIENGIHE